MNGASGDGSSRGSSRSSGGSDAGKYAPLNREHQAGRERTDRVITAGRNLGHQTEPIHGRAAAPAAISGNDWAAQAAAIALQVKARLFGPHPSPAPGGEVTRSRVAPAAPRVVAPVQVTTPARATNSASPGRPGGPAATPPGMRVEVATLWDRRPDRVAGEGPHAPGTASISAAIDVAHDRAVAKDGPVPGQRPATAVAGQKTSIAARSPSVEVALKATTPAQTMRVELAALWEGPSARTPAESGRAPGQASISATIDVVYDRLVAKGTPDPGPGAAVAAAGQKPPVAARNSTVDSALKSAKSEVSKAPAKAASKKVEAKDTPDLGMDAG